MSGWENSILEFCNDMSPWDSPRVEYKLTAFGEKFVHILNEIEKLNQEIEHGLIEQSRRELVASPYIPL